jgi:hypothetical protein
VNAVAIRCHAISHIASAAEPEGNMNSFSKTIADYYPHIDQQDIGWVIDLFARRDISACRRNLYRAIGNKTVLSARPEDTW